MPDTNESIRYSFKSLNYLGCKLRLLDFIEENIKEVTPNGCGVCDLFAGSGCVAYRLSRSYAVTACDIQTYSQIISSALLERFCVSKRELDAFFAYTSSKSAVDLLEIFRPLITLEESAIKQKQMSILANILEYGSLKVFSLEKKDSPIDEELDRVCRTLESVGYSHADSIISRYYGGIYFSYRQAVEIDIIQQAIDECIEEKNRNLFLAALLSTASEIAATVGKHFAQPVKARDSKGMIKTSVYNKAVKDKMLDVMSLYRKWLDVYMRLPKTDNTHRVIRGDYMDCLKTLPDNVRTIYADPPYTRDHYSRFYHVLETIALKDNPELSTVTIHGRKSISNGIYRKERHQSPFCVRSEAQNAFTQLFEYAHDAQKNLIMSYSPYDSTKKTHPRVVTMEQIVSLAEAHFDSIDIVSAGRFTHSKLNSTKYFLEASEEAELLLICSNGKL